MSAHSSFSFAVLFLAGALAAAAQTTPPAAFPAPSTVTLDPLTVSAGLDRAREDIVPSLGATQYQTSRAQIEAQPLGLDSRFDQILLREPGVAGDSFGQVHIRGEHANLQYRINDVLLPEGLSGFGQELDARFVATMSLLTGALPAQYGDRTAGVVDIHTGNGRSGTGGVAELGGGSNESWRLSAEASGADGPISGYATVSLYRTDLGIENPTASLHALHDRTRQAKAFAYASRLLDDSSRLTLVAGVSFAEFQIPDNPGQEPAFVLAGAQPADSARLDENQLEDNGYAILAWQRSTPDFSAQASAFTRYSLLHFTPDRVGDLEFNGVASDVRRELAGDGLEADLKWAPSPEHAIRGGGLVTAANPGSRTTTAAFPAGPDGGADGTTPVVIADDHRKLGRFAGAYLQDEWKPASGLTLNYGARADASWGYLAESQLSPRANLVDRIDEVTTLHAGYARYFTPPPLELVQPADLTRFAGTVNAPAVTASSPVRAERADYFDAGLSLRLTPAFTLTLDGYDKRAVNLLDEGQFGQALIFSPFNYRRGEIKGIELSGNYTHGGWSAYANVARSRATAREIVSGEFQFDPDELAFIATHDVQLDHDQQLTASAGVSWRMGGTLAYADLLYGSGLRSGFANGDHLPDYHPFNLGAEHAFSSSEGHGWKVRVDVVNLFDEVYALRDGSGIGVGAPQYGARRAVFGSASFGF